MYLASRNSAWRARSGVGRLARVPDHVHQRQVVVADRVGVDREAAPLGQLVLGAQVDHGAQAQPAHDLEVGFGEAVQAVGPEQRPPAGRDPAVAGGVPAQVTEVERRLQGHVPLGLDRATWSTVPTARWRRGVQRVTSPTQAEGHWSRLPTARVTFPDGRRSRVGIVGIGPDGRGHRRGGGPGRLRGRAAFAGPDARPSRPWPASTSPSPSRSPRASSTRPSARPSSPASRRRPTLADLFDCDLVIESVVEDLAVKKPLFAELDAVCKPERHPRHEHVHAVGDRAGRPDQAPRPRLRHPLLQPGAGHVAGRGRAAADRHRRHDRRRQGRSSRRAARTPST